MSGSVSAAYQAMLSRQARLLAAHRGMIEDCRRGRQAVADEEPSAPGAKRRRGGGRAAGAALLGSILGFNPYGDLGGAASGSQGSSRFGE